jgi:hypothetical protein
LLPSTHFEMIGVSGSSTVETGAYNSSIRMPIPGVDANLSHQLTIKPRLGLQAFCIGDSSTNRPSRPVFSEFEANHEISESQRFRKRAASPRHTTYLDRWPVLLTLMAAQAFPNLADRHANT